MNETKLIEKLKLIEALFAGATTEGEKDAAFNALLRIKERLKEVQKTDPPVEYKFTMSDIWSRKLFVSLLRRYDIPPYRYYLERMNPQKNSYGNPGLLSNIKCFKRCRYDADKKSVSGSGS